MKFLKKLVGGVAMIAAPFIAAPIAGAFGISSALGTSLIGAGVGALGARVAGVNPLIGAGIGGLGAFGVGGGFGDTAAGGLFGGGASAAAPGAAGAGIAGAAPATIGAGAAAAPAAGGLLGGLGGNLAPALVQMALATYGKAPQDLTEQEREAMREQARRQGIQENVFNQAFEQTRMLAQRAVPDAEGAFGRTQIAASRALDEDVRGATRGQRGAAQRRAAIGSTLAGAGGVAAEGQRADAAAGQAANAMAGLRPPSQSAAEQALAMYGDLYKRRQDFGGELAGAFGGFAGRAG